MWQSFHHIGALHFVYLHRLGEENTARVKVLAGALEAGKEGLYRNLTETTGHNEMCESSHSALSANNGKPQLGACRSSVPSNGAYPSPVPPRLPRSGVP
jgi:hypothetical protein